MTDTSEQIDQANTAMAPEEHAAPAPAVETNSTEEHTMESPAPVTQEPKQDDTSAPSCQESQEQHKDDSQAAEITAQSSKAEDDQVAQDGVPTSTDEPMEVADPQQNGPAAEAQTDEQESGVAQSSNAELATESSDPYNGADEAYNATELSSSVPVPGDEEASGEKGQKAQEEQAGDHANNSTASKPVAASTSTGNASNASTNNQHGKFGHHNNRQMQGRGRGGHYVGGNRGGFGPRPFNNRGGAGPMRRGGFRGKFSSFSYLSVFFVWY
ncbi:MAG: hypothetical protein BYD32DRAFT_299426 [Podila humilis]|nr:MAG: hypothetical protein BYD32DRAFT_299426 [Podila humilis]